MLTGYRVEPSVVGVKNTKSAVTSVHPQGGEGADQMEILILVLALVALDVAAQLYAADSRPPEAERGGS